MRDRERARFRRGAYLIPSLFTTGNLLCGYIAVVRSVQGEFEWAAIAVFIAALLDRVDGWVARLTGTTSDFGVQFDSLADVISFGIAPALLAYLWALSALPKWATSKRPPRNSKLTCCVASSAVIARRFARRKPFS